METLHPKRKGYINSNCVGINQKEMYRVSLLYITFQADLFDVLIFVIYLTILARKKIGPPTGSLPYCVERICVVLVTWRALLLGAYKEPSIIPGTGADL
jgi:hypothetical protein